MVEVVIELTKQTYGDDKLFKFGKYELVRSQFCSMRKAKLDARKWFDLKGFDINWIEVRK